MPAVAQAALALLLSQPPLDAVLPASASPSLGHFQPLATTLLARVDDEPTPLESALLLACGALWTLTYLLLIANAHRTRTTGMPYFALALNVTWELLFAAITPHPWPQRAIDVLWLALDCVILLQTLVYYPYRAAPLRMSFCTFAMGTAATLATSLALNWAWSVALDDRYGAYSAFVSNLFMSVSYVAMYYQRQPRGSGQSVCVAVCKMAGTACSSVAFFMLSTHYNALLNFCFVAVFCWDALYVVLLVSNGWWQSIVAEEADQQWWMRVDESSASMVVSQAVLTESRAPAAWDDRQQYRYR